MSIFVDLQSAEVHPDKYSSKRLYCVFQAKNNNQPFNIFVDNQHNVYLDEENPEFDDWFRNNEAHWDMLELSDAKFQEFKSQH